MEEAFNLGTIQGARAIGMSSKIGSIAEGKIADLVILDATSPALVCAAQHDPVAAIVLHSSPADVDMVIVDGIVRKREGKLLSVQLDGRGRDISGGEQVGWLEVSRQLIKSRVVLQKQIDTLDMAEALKDTIKARQIDETKIVDHVQG